MDIDQRYDDIDQRYDDIDQRYDDIDKRYDDIDKRYDDTTTEENFFLVQSFFSPDFLMKTYAVCLLTPSDICSYETR